MASVSDLNIRLGVAYREFDKSMRQVENRLRQSAQTIGGIADNMMSAISVPILGLGAVAIKAAGDFEALRLALNTTMVDAGYSTAQVAKELEALRKVALAPGIDLEQAVKGSIRLQSVGFSAERARVTLTELANALAASGGNAQQLDGVTRQFAQMAAKGKIMQEDLTIILENMPSLAKVLMQAFGTTNAEAIRNMGVSADEFITKITEGLQKTARVQGGVKNAIDNARSALTQFFVSIGDGINEAYNLNQVAEDMSRWLGQVASAFRNLDPETKKSIINFALYAAAAGPVLKIFSGLFVAGQTLVSGLRTVGGAMASLGGGALNLIDKFGKLSAAMKFTYIGAAIAIIGALYLGFQKLNDVTEQAMHTTRALNEVEKTANESISEQKVQTESLIGVLKSETTTRDEKLAAIKRLNEISPEYFKGLKLEGDSVKGLTEAYDGYIANLLKAARVKAAEEKLIEIDRKKLKLQEDLLRQEQSRVANFQATTGGLGSVAAFEQQASNTKKDLIENINREISAVNSEEAALRKVIEDNLVLEPAQHKAAAATNTAAESSKKKTKAVQEETASMKDLINTLDVLTAQNLGNTGASGEVGAAPTIPTGQLPPVVTSEQTDELVNLVAVLGSEVPTAAATAQTAFDTLSLHFQGMMDAFTAGGEAQQQIFAAVGASIVDMTNSGSVSMKDFAKNAASSAIKVAKAYAVQGIFAAVSKALQSVPFPFNIIAAGVAAGAAGALLNGLANRIAAPKLAKGGLAYGPTLAMVGDNPGAASDPEVISPLSKLQSIMGSAGQMISLNGNFKIRGQDLELVLAKASKTQQRIRGK